MSDGADRVVEAATLTVVRDDTAFWTLYESAFPAEEREPASVILAGVERGLVEVLRIRLAGETLGFSVVHRLRHPSAAFLVYLAVVPAARGTGLGAALFRAVAARSPGGVVWEIDLPSTAKDETERRLRERRQHFFEELGGRVVTTDYLQPAINGPAPVPMALMASGAALTAPVDTLIEALYVEKYAALNGVAVPELDSFGSGA